jgi:uncharacterized circularly permuted ATP-grasp superfamily protein
VFLKTLSGLRRVHAIMRRLDDDFCDPLELRTDSALGVPGLLEAVRQGRVLVANALGSGVLESPGLLGFLPKINQYLFGEELMLPSIATWWCGEAPVLAQALEKLPELLIKPAFPSQSFAPVFGRDLSEPSARRSPSACRRGHTPMSRKNWRSCRRRRSGAEDGQLQPEPSACACTPWPVAMAIACCPVA